MIKKLFLGTAVLGAALAVIPLVGLGSYATTTFSKIRGTFKRQVPIDFEISRVRNEVAQLIPDMKKNVRLIAEEKVAVGNMKDEIADMRVSMKNQKARLLAMTEQVQTGHELVSYGGQEYNNHRLADKLSHDFRLYQLAEKELASKEKILEAKEDALNKVVQQLASMQDQKRELEVQIAQLESQLQSVRLTQTQSKVQLDDSRLAHIKGSLAEIRNRLKVEETEAALHSEFGSDEAPAVNTSRPAASVTKEVQQYFGKNGEHRVAEKR